MSSARVYLSGVLCRYQDVNEDGYPDLTTHYDVQLSGIQSGDAEVCLAGEIAGTPFYACDSITTLGK